MRNDDYPAFPQEYKWPEEEKSLAGMSLRDYFAAAALTGMFASDTSSSGMSAETKAKDAYEAADALLIQRLQK